MKQFIFTLLLSISLGTISYSQSSFFKSTDSIAIQKNDVLGLHYVHKLKAKQTIYSLGKFFNSSVNEILQYNVKKPDHIFGIGDEVLLAFNADVLLTDLDSPIFDHTPMLTVYYIVQPKDNLFRISREYFPQQMDHLMTNNRLRSFNLDIGQKLIVGWIPLPMGSGEPHQYRPNRNAELVSVASISQIDNVLTHPETIDKIKQATVVVEESDNEELDSSEELKLVKILSDLEFSNSDLAVNADTDILTDEDLVTIDNEDLAEKEEEGMIEEEIIEEGMEEVETKEVVAPLFHNRSGIAIWDKQIKDDQNLFVLHKSAKPNTIIELYYPLLNTHVQAKVVGNIPKGIYPKEVDVIISPKVAKTLGVIDGRFQIDMKFYR